MPLTGRDVAGSGGDGIAVRVVDRVTHSLGEAVHLIGGKFVLAELGFPVPIAVADSGLFGQVVLP